MFYISYKRVTLIASGVLLSLASTAQAQQKSVSVGSVVSAPGQKVTGFLDVPAGVDEGTKIPVAIIQGAKPGPVLALVSGSHGTEYASIIALEKLVQKLNPEELSGTVIALPLVNIASFEQKVPHVNPVDHKSMNRFYPGKPDGTQTERVSWLITHEVVDKCDYLIDYHGGDLDENLRPYGYWSPTGQSKQDELSRQMVLAFGVDHIVIERDHPKDIVASKYLGSTSELRGKPTLVVEAGYAGTTETDDVDLLTEGTLNVMKQLKMISGTPPVMEHPVWIEKIASITSEKAGIFYSSVKRGTFAEAGMKIGYVTDYFGNTIYEARAPQAGVVLYICSVPSMKQGDTIAYIGVLVSTQK